MPESESIYDKIEQIRAKAIEEELRLVIKKYSSYYKGDELRYSIFKYCNVFQSYMNIRLVCTGSFINFYISKPMGLNIISFSIDMRNI